MLGLTLLVIASKFYASGNEVRAKVMERLGNATIVFAVVSGALLWLFYCWLKMTEAYNADALEHCTEDCTNLYGNLGLARAGIAWCKVTAWVILAI